MLCCINDVKILWKMLPLTNTQKQNLITFLIRLWSPKQHDGRYNK